MVDFVTAFRSIRERSLFALLDKESAQIFLENSKVFALDAGEVVPRGPNVDAIFIVLDGHIDLFHANDKSEPVGRVTKGRSIEIGSVLEASREWKYDWVAGQDALLLEITSTSYKKVWERNPVLATYLKRISIHSELQKIKNDLRMYGMRPAEIRHLIENIGEKDGEFFSNNKVEDGGCLVIVRSGEIEFRYDFDGDSKSVGRFGAGDYFIIPESRAEKLTTEIHPNTKVWYIDIAKWSKVCDVKLIQGFIKLIDPLTRRIAAQEAAAQKAAESEMAAVGPDEEDDGLTVQEFEVKPKDLQFIWKMKRYEVKQQDEMDCGAACLAAISRFWGRRISIPSFRSLVHVTRDGASMLSLKKAAERVGFKGIGIMSGPKGLMKLQVPCIALMQYHFVVVFKITEAGVELNDPARGLVTMTFEEFTKDWSQNALLLKPTKKFFSYPESAMTFAKYGLIISDSISLLAEILLASILIFIFGLASPLFMQFIFDNVLADKSKGALHGLAIIMIGINLLSGVTEYVRSYLLSHLTSKVDAKFSALFMRHTLKLPLNFFAVRRVGDITTRLGELVKIRDFFTGRTVSMVINAFSILLYCVVVYLYSPKILALILLLLPLLIGFIAFMVPRLTANLQNTYRAMAKNQSLTFEHFNSLETLKSIHGLVSARWRWETQSMISLRLRREFERLSSIIAGGSEFFREGIQISVLLVAVYLYIRNEMSLGQVVALNSLIGSIIRPAIAMVSEWNTFNQVGVSLARVDDIITSAVEAEPKSRDHAGLQIKGEIEFENVSFQYGSELSPIILDGISFKVQAGETVAIVGGSGSGKTTLGYMVNLLYAPTKGRILIDGIDAAEIPKATLRRQVAMIMQDNSLFSGTVIDNICIGDPHPSFSKAIEVSKLADAHGFVAKMKNGYATILGEGGTGLSGGQKQRLNISRALYLDPAILIMDEATSALDASSEQTIVNNLKSREKSRTTIIIAHRLNTVMHADKIIVMENGRVQEMGTHAQLLARQGRYFELFRKQINF